MMTPTLELFMSVLAASAEDTFTPHRDTVIMDGGMQFWAGLSYGAASLVNYLYLSGLIRLATPAMLGLVWMAATAAFVLFGVILKVGTERALLREPGFKRFRALWGSLILGAGFLIGALIIMMNRFGLGANTAFIVSPIALSVYGIGWRLAAVTTCRKWPNLLSVGAFLCAIYLATLAGTPQQSLVYTLCLVAFAIIPGLLLLLRRSAI